MNNNTTPSVNFADTKPHYELLDGLRGVAALLVVLYHIYEGYAFAGGGTIKFVNHGLLAIDFFFILSGFVISYAYDDRWGKMTIGDFFKRRLIRLHPMIIIGTIVGVAAFLIGGRHQWSGAVTPYSWVMVAMLLTMFLIPAVPGAGYEVRGNGEMYPLNGSMWSLFF
ncbi:MAG: acyltransferase, partial [Alistipes sp.]|nr:acyltransferase [Alistipes sp.]